MATNGLKFSLIQLQKTIGKFDKKILRKTFATVFFWGEKTWKYETSSW